MKRLCMLRSRIQKGHLEKDSPASMVWFSRTICSRSLAHLANKTRSRLLDCSHTQTSNVRSCDTVAVVSKGQVVQRGLDLGIQIYRKQIAWLHTAGRFAELINDASGQLAQIARHLKGRTPDEKQFDGSEIDLGFKVSNYILDGHQTLNVTHWNGKMEQKLTSFCNWYPFKISSLLQSSAYGTFRTGRESCKKRKRSLSLKTESPYNWCHRQKTRYKVTFQSRQLSQSQIPGGSFWFAIDSIFAEPHSCGRCICVWRQKSCHAECWYVKWPASHSCSRLKRFWFAQRKIGAQKRIPSLL